MTPDARAEQGRRERDRVRVWVNVTSGVWNPVYTWHCPACGLTPLAPVYSSGAEGLLPEPAPLKYVRRSAIRDALGHARTCPALRLARLEAELEKLAGNLDQAAEIAANDGGPCWRGRSSDYRLTALWLTQILARHRQASNGE